jgi:hypothetical protein
MKHLLQTIITLLGNMFGVATSKPSLSPIYRDETLLARFTIAQGYNKVVLVYDSTYRRIIDWWHTSDEIISQTEWARNSNYAIRRLPMNEAERTRYFISLNRQINGNETLATPTHIFWKGSPTPKRYFGDIFGESDLDDDTAEDLSAYVGHTPRRRFYECFSVDDDTEEDVLNPRQ